MKLIIFFTDKNFWYEEGKARLRMELAKTRNLGIAKNIIFFVGDGMGLPTITASRIYKGQLQKENGEEGYHSYDMFPDVGLVKVRKFFTVEDQKLYQGA